MAEDRTVANKILRASTASERRRGFFCALCFIVSGVILFTLSNRHVAMYSRSNSQDKNEEEVALRRQKVDMKSVWMDNVEIEVILHYLGGINTYLEWGSGGSTRNFAQFARQRVASIEHSVKWCEIVRNQMRALRVPKVGISCISPSASFTGDGTYPEMREYVDEIDKLGEAVWDFILVDGRCRVGSALKALSYISGNSTVVLHDSERTEYSRIFDFYDVIDRVSGINRRGVAVLRRKEAYKHLEGNHALVQRLLNNKYRSFSPQ